MRVLYCTRDCNIHDLRFLRAFSELGVEVGLLSSDRAMDWRGRRRLPAGVSDQGSLSLERDAITGAIEGVAPAFKQVVDRFRPSVILAGPLHDVAFLVAKAGVSCPWIAQSWAFDVLWDPTARPEVLPRISLVLELCSGLLADCHAVVRRCSELGWNAERPVHLLPWGIDFVATQPSWTRDQARRELGIEDRDFLYLCTRNLEPVYGIGVLLGAFEELTRRTDRARLMLAGSGSLRDEVESWMASQDERLAKRVQLLGGLEHEELLKVLIAADCHVAPVESDGTSISLLEAMYCGVLPIVSDVGGNPEWVRHGENGWLVQVGDPGSVAMAMLEAIDLEATERQGIASHNRTVVRERADWRKNFPEFVRFMSSMS